MNLHWHRLFLLMLALVLVTPFTGVFAQTSTTATAATNGSITLSEPTQPPSRGALPGTWVPLLAFAFTNSGNATATVSSITLQKGGTAPDATITGLALADTSVNFLASEVVGSSTVNASHQATLTLPLPLQLAPKQSHSFLVWGMADKWTIAANLGKTFSFNLVAVGSPASLVGMLPVSGATYTIAGNVAYPAPVCYLSVNPSSIFVGDSVTVRWSSRNATSTYISSIGQVSTSGVLNTLLSSAHVTNFVGTFTGPGGSVRCSASVTVNAGTGLVGIGSYVNTSGTNAGQYPDGYSLSTYSLKDPTQLSATDPLNSYGLKDPNKLNTYGLKDPTQLKTYSLNTTTLTPPPSTFNTATPAAGTNANTTNSSGGFLSSLVPNCGQSASNGRDYSQTGTLSVTNPDGTPGSVPNIQNAVSATSCNLCDFGQLIQNIVNYLILIAIPLSAGLFGYAGMLYFTAMGDSHKISKARAIFKSVVIGFAIAVSGYLVVQVILNGLLSPQYNGGTFRWTQLQCYDANHTDASGTVRPRNASISDIFNSLYNNPNSTYNAQVVQNQSAGPSASLSVVVSAMCQLESGCGQNVDNGTGTGCNNAPIPACGPMQIQTATACSTNPGFSSGCNANGTVADNARVVSDLQSVPNSQALAAQILTNAQNSTQCGGSLPCAIALYSQGPTALQPSACCSSGAAYSCAYNCGTTVAASYRCDVNPSTPPCVPVPPCTGTQCSAYSYIKKLGI